MPKFRQKPLVIEAVPWNPEARNAYEWFRELKRAGAPNPGWTPTTYELVASRLHTSGCSKDEPYWGWEVMGMIETLKGQLFLVPGDWLVTGIKGEMYPCKNEIFVAIYEPVEEPA